MLLYVWDVYYDFIYGKEKKIVLFVGLFPGMLLLFLIEYRCLLNKRQERRQNDMRMRVERLQKVMEGEYAYRLSGVMKYSNQRGCMNIIMIYERRIRELFGFYILVI